MDEFRADKLNAHLRPSSQPVWTREQDEQPFRASDGTTHKHWDRIAAPQFPAGSSQACRKRYGRLKRSAKQEVPPLTRSLTPQAESEVGPTTIPLEASPHHTEALKRMQDYHV